MLSNSWFIKYLREGEGNTIVVIKVCYYNYIANLPNSINLVSESSSMIAFPMVERGLAYGCCEESIVDALDLSASTTSLERIMNFCDAVIRQ